MLAIWSLFPLPFLNPAWTNGSHCSYTVETLFGEFECSFANVRDECSCAVVWTFFVIAFLGIEMETDLFKSCDHYWVFQICWRIEYSSLTASSFRIWISSTGIPSPPLFSFVVMLPKAHLTSLSRMSGSRWVITPSWLLGYFISHYGYYHEDLFCVVLQYIPATSS